MRGTRGTSPPFFIATRRHHSRKETKRKKKTARGSASVRFYNVRGGRHPVAPVLVEVDGYYAKVRVSKRHRNRCPLQHIVVLPTVDGKN